MNIEIWSCDKLGRAGIYPLVSAGWSDVQQSGYGTPTQVPFHESYPVVYATVDGVPVGFIVWSPPGDNGEAWVMFGYVATAYRQKGIYRRIYAEVRRLAIEAKASTLLGGIIVGNRAAEEAALALGRKPSFVVYEDALEALAPAAIQKEPESDAAYRSRIQNVAGTGTVNQMKINTAIGEELNEVGAIYQVKRN